jgi:hypothetical protein
MTIDKITLFAAMDMPHKVFSEDFLSAKNSYKKYVVDLNRCSVPKKICRLPISATK